MLLLLYKWFNILDYVPALNNNLNVDDTANTFYVFLTVDLKYMLIHMLRMLLLNNTMLLVIKVHHLMTIILLPICSTTNGESSWSRYFPTKIGLRQDTEWIQNSFANSSADGSIDITTLLLANQNFYYRRVQVANLM